MQMHSVNSTHSEYLPYFLREKEFKYNREEPINNIAIHVLCMSGMLFVTSAIVDCPQGIVVSLILGTVAGVAYFKFKEDIPVSDIPRFNTLNKMHKLQQSQLQQSRKIHFKDESSSTDDHTSEDSKDKEKILSSMKKKQWDDDSIIKEGSKEYTDIYSLD